MPSLDRIRRDEIPSNRIWDVYAAHQLERVRILRWIEDEAEQVLRQPDSSAEKVKAAAGALLAQIVGLFATRESTRDVPLINEAKSGELAREAPKLWVIRGASAMKWLTMSIEVGIFAALWLMGHGSPVLLVHGAALAVAGWAVGFGVGREFFYSPPKRHPTGFPRAPSFAGIVLGLLGIALVAYTRYRANPEDALVVVGMTTLIALLVAFFKALELSSREAYDRIVGDMYLAQIWTATERHLGDLTGGLWVKRFEEKIGGELGKVEEVFKGEPSEPPSATPN
jgi:hypothetical protein